MDNTNDGGMMRVRGTSESNCVLELATWDDSGGGETIQFNYYPTTSTVTPTYSISVPKKSGTIALSGDTITTPFLGVQSGYQDVDVRYICCYGKSGASYINFGYQPSTANCGELCYSYVGSGSGDNWVGLGFYGRNHVQFYYNSNTTFHGAVYSDSDRYLKKNIHDIDKRSLINLFNVSDKLIKKFTWKRTCKDSYGFIAQELEKYIPEAVTQDNEGIKSVSYDIAYAKIIAALVHKVKEQANTIEEIRTMLSHIS